MNKDTWWNSIMRMITKIKLDGGIFVVALCLEIGDSCNTVIFLDIKTRDMYVVDKWTRMFIKSILEMNRLLWKGKCTILHLENESTYEQRQRDGIWQFCLHLRRNLHLVPHADRHFLWKSHGYFY